MTIEIEQLETELARVEEKLAKARTSNSSWPRTIKMYLHGSKESDWEMWMYNGELDGMTEEDCQNHFIGTLYEVEFDVSVNRDGTSKILKVKCGSEVLFPDDPR